MPAGEHGRDRRDAAREFQVGGGAVRDDGSRAARERDLVRFQVHRVDRNQAWPEQAQSLEPGERAHAMMVVRLSSDLVLGLVHVHVNRKVELGGVSGDAFAASRRDTVYGAWGARQNDSRGSSRESIAHGEAFAQVVVRVARVGRRQSRSRSCPIGGAHAARSAACAAASGKKYMSLKQVMPPRSISAQASSVPSCTNGRRHHARLDRPDMVIAQPVHQRHVVRQAAQQRHRAHACAG